LPEGVVSSALLEAPSRPAPCPQDERPHDGRSLTLEQRLETAWRCAQQAGVVECPVCRASMRRADGAARCEGCDSVVL
jgi:hypothetical protein